MIIMMMVTVHNDGDNVGDEDNENDDYNDDKTYNNQEQQF